MLPVRKLAAAFTLALGIAPAEADTIRDFQRGLDTAQQFLDLLDGGRYDNQRRRPYDRYDGYGRRDYPRAVICWNSQRGEHVHQGGCKRGEIYIGEYRR